MVHKLHRFRLSKNETKNFSDSITNSAETESLCGLSTNVIACFHSVNMSDTSKIEAVQLRLMRNLSTSKATGQMKYMPDIIGDNKLLRFLRSRSNNPQEAAEMYDSYLLWR